MAGGPPASAAGLLDGIQYVASGFTGFGDASGLIAGFIQDRVARSANFGQWSISCPCVRRPQISRDSLAWMTE